MYFLTSQDPNYNVKGSRDPLGFQVIWQEAGRRLIPNLSTVSSDIKDFQILSLSFAIKDEFKMEDREFESFFIRFEQLMAYTRFRQNQKEGFNGVDKVRKIMSTNPLTVKISNNSSEQILSNQRAYGIWGKYIRPFLDMGLLSDPVFKKIYLGKLVSNTAFYQQVQSLRKKGEGVSQVNLQKLDNFFNLIQKPKAEERKLFIKYLLKDTCDNELLNVLKTVKIHENLLFYELLQQLSKSTQNDRFKAVLNQIRETEKVLSPLNHIFRYLQTRSYWKLNELEQDEFISAWRSKVDHVGINDSVQQLAALMNLSNIELVSGLIKCNEEVSKRRKSAAWMKMTDSGLEVNHFEGGFFWGDYNPEKHCDNMYFLSTFLRLYKQLN